MAVSMRMDNLNSNKSNNNNHLSTDISNLPNQQQQKQQQQQHEEKTQAYLPTKQPCLYTEQATLRPGIIHLHSFVQSRTDRQGPPTSPRRLAFLQHQAEASDTLVRVTACQGLGRLAVTATYFLQAYGLGGDGVKLNERLTLAHQRLGVDIKATVAFDGHAGHAHHNLNGGGGNRNRNRNAPSSLTVFRTRVGRDYFDIIVSEQVAADGNSDRHGHEHEHEHEHEDEHGCECECEHV